MTSWNVRRHGKAQLRDPILLEGLPGIGNVGKIVVDFLVDELNTELLYELHSPTLPHSVFITEDNLVELPTITIHRAKLKDRDLLLLAGDVQPQDEVSCYEFCQSLISLCRQHKVRDIITLGGIGLSEIPKKPRIFCTGNTKAALAEHKDKAIAQKLYGVVGPIVGVTGMLLGLADRKMRAVALLSETLGHPMYLGVKGSKEILGYLKRKYGVKVTLSKLDEEIAAMESEMLKKSEEIASVQHQTAKKQGETTYIG